MSTAMAARDLAEGTLSSIKGRFVTVEGIDGAGKSTHIEAIAQWLAADGTTVVRSREPGGTELAERLRDLVLHTPMDAMTEALLVFAARRDHLQRVITPALVAGHTVLCDRFTDATFAYQGAGRGFRIDVLTQLESWVQASVMPDLTLWFDLEPSLAASRRAGAREGDRFEREDDLFFRRVRDGYRERMRANPQRVVRIDAGGDRASVVAQILHVLRERGWVAT